MFSIPQIKKKFVVSLLRENQRRLIGSWSNIWLDIERKINEPVLIVRLAFCLMSNWTSNLSFDFF